MAAMSKSGRTQELLTGREQQRDLPRARVYPFINYTWVDQKVLLCPSWKVNCLPCKLSAHESGPISTGEKKYSNRSIAAEGAPTLLAPWVAKLTSTWNYCPRCSS